MTARKAHRTRFLISGFLGMVIGLLAVASANLAIDSRDLYSNDTARVHDAARAYVDYLISNPGPAPEVPFVRASKIELLQKQPADCFVLGSSRVMGVDLTTVPELRSSCRHLSNLWVPAAGFEDTIAYLGAIAQKAPHGTVYVEIWLNDMRQQSTPLWLDVESQFNSAVKMFGIKYHHPYFSSSDVTLFLNIFNLNYLSLNIRSFYLPVFDRIRRAQKSTRSTLANGAKSYLRPATTDENRCFASGRCAYKSSQRAEKWDPVTNRTQTIIFPAVDAVVYSAYEHAFRFLKNKGIEPVMLLMPYRSQVWDCQNPDYCRALTETEKAARRLAAKINLRVIGSFDPRKIGLSDQAFLDTLHLRHSDLEKVFRLQSARLH